MGRLALLIAMACAAAPSLASESKDPLASCVPSNACGCSVVISGNSCPNGEANFFHELSDGTPLNFNLGHGLATATSTRARTNIFSPGPGDSWTETYRYGNGTIEIRYSPGANTCPKTAQGEQCEYFDVRALVLVSDQQGTRRYLGAGTCGC